MTGAAVPTANVPDTTSEKLSATDLLEQLHDGRLQPGDLTTEQRQQCVNYLTLEGFSTTDISQMMQISERTIRRDRAALRHEYALQPDVHLADELLGEFQQVVISSNQRLIRLARDSRIAPNSRLWAEGVIVQNYKRFIEMVQRLSYLRDGRSRLKQQLYSDPAELDHEATALTRNLRVLERARQLDHARPEQEKEVDAMIDLVMKMYPPRTPAQKQEQDPPATPDRKANE